jgi:hypothetical protein
MADPAVTSVSGRTQLSKKDDELPHHFQLRRWADIQHESDEELIQRYESRTHPIGPVVLGQPCRIFRIAVDALIKLSAAGEWEINAMTLVATQTTVPVPSLLRVVPTAKHPRRWRFIVIRYIPGANLEDRWPTLSWWRRAIVLWTLRRYVRKFWKIPLGNRPPGPIGDGPQLCFGPAFHEDYVCIGPPSCAGSIGADHRDRSD